MAKFGSLAPPSGNLALWSARAFYLSLNKIWRNQRVIGDTVFFYAHKCNVTCGRVDGFNIRERSSQITGCMVDDWLNRWSIQPACGVCVLSLGLHCFFPGTQASSHSAQRCAHYAHVTLWTRLTLTLKQLQHSECKRDNHEKSTKKKKGLISLHLCSITNSKVTLLFTQSAKSCIIVLFFLFLWIAVYVNVIICRQWFRFAVCSLLGLLWGNSSKGRQRQDVRPTLSTFYAIIPPV